MRRLRAFAGEQPELSVRKIFAELETRLGVRAGIDYDKGWLRKIVTDTGPERYAYPTGGSVDADVRGGGGGGAGRMLPMDKLEVPGVVP